MHTLVERIKKQDIRALARVITMIENEHTEKISLLSEIFKVQSNAQIVGLTGSPGAGKSSLVNRLIAQIRSEGKTVAVIAVDPTSPFSGGALLGDRVRMGRHFTDNGVFIRSMATRGSLGGLARATKDVIRACGAFGFDVIIVETVGVGQSELDIMKVVDTTALVMTPNSGDVMQIFKAGIMEIADLFVINKADLEGVAKLRAMLRELVKMTAKKDHKIPVLKTITTNNEGIDKLWLEIQAHHKYLHQTHSGRQRREKQRQLEVYELVREEIWREVKHFIEQRGDLTPDYVNDDPYTLAKVWFKKWKREEGGLIDE